MKALVAVLYHCVVKKKERKKRLFFFPIVPSGNLGCFFMLFMLI